MTTCLSEIGIAMKRLTELREQRGLSMMKLSKEIGVSDATISNYENDIREPKIKTLEALAKFFNVTPQYLVGWTDEK